MSSNLVSQQNNRASIFQITIYYCYEWRDPNTEKKIYLVLSLIHSATGNLWITKLATRKNNGTHEIPTTKHFGPTKCLREKICSQEILSRKISTPRNTHEKKLWTHEIPTKKNFHYTKARLHDGTRPTRPTMACDQVNLARSF